MFLSFLVSPNEVGADPSSRLNLLRYIPINANIRFYHVHSLLGGL